MAKGSYTITIKGWDNLLKNFKKSPAMVANEISSAIKTSVNLVRPIMKKEAPHGKGSGNYTGGRLRENIYARFTKKQGFVGPDLNTTPYAYFVHEGTKPHTIRPRKKNALYWPGAKHPVKLVRHPGTNPNKFIERTHNIVKPHVEKIFSNAMNNITRNLAK